MKKNKLFLTTFTFLAASASPALTADPAIEWYSIDSGGGDSSGGSIQLSGVIGQFDTAQLNGGSITLSGGLLALPPRADELFKDGFE